MSEVRRARSSEAAAIAKLYIEARKAAPIPPAIHPDAEVGTWIAETLLTTCEVWVAANGRAPVAMIGLSDGWVEQLYVSPPHQGQGHGSRLLELAQSRQDALKLWTFASNLPVRRFYEERGFTRSGPASDDNEEQAPALLYRWSRSI